MKRLRYPIKIAGLFAAGAIWMGASMSANAAFDQTFYGSSGNLSASVRFEQRAAAGGDLIITLVNTSSFDVNNAGQVLTALFFNIDPTGVLTKKTAVLGAGSTVLYGGGTDTGGGVGGEWGFKTGLTGTSFGNTILGISSAGLGLFSASDAFGGSNLGGPGKVGGNPGSFNGVEYGITSAGDVAATHNGSIGTANPVIKNSVVFTFSLTAGYVLGGIEDVNFQYGTGLGEIHVSAVPEPTTMIAGALLLLPFGASTLRVLRRIRKS